MNPETHSSGHVNPIEISLLLPAFNEEKRIAGTIAEAVGYFEKAHLTFEVIVIADGTDRTRDIVSELASKDPRIRVLGGKDRRGKGYALRLGVREARGRFIGFADADNKTPIEQFDLVLPHLKNGAEVVMGSRRYPGAKIELKQSWVRRVGSVGFSIFMHGIVGLWDIRDTQCGFKFYPQSAARRLFAASFVDGYIYDVEILFLARKFNYRIVQIPIRWRDDGDSRLALVSQNLQNFLDVVRIRLHRYPE